VEQLVDPCPDIRDTDDFQESPQYSLFAVSYIYCGCCASDIVRCPCNDFRRVYVTLQIVVSFLLSPTKSDDNAIVLFVYLLSVRPQDDSKKCGQIAMKFSD